MELVPYDPKEKLKRNELHRMIDDLIGSGKFCVDFWQYRSKAKNIFEILWIDREVLSHLLDRILSQPSTSTSANIIDLDNIIYLFINESSVASDLVSQALNKLIESMAKSWTIEKQNWNKHHLLCGVLFSILYKCSNSLSEQLIDKVFDYFHQLLYRLRDIKSVNKTIELILLFPFDKFESSLLWLIESNINGSSKIDSKDRRQKYQVLCSKIKDCLSECKNSLSYQIGDQWFSGYMMKVFAECDNLETIQSALTTLMQLEFDLIESQLRQMITFLVQNVQSSGPNWKAHLNLCSVIAALSKSEMKTEFKNLLLSYIIELFGFPDNWEIILSALFTVENMCFMNQEINIEQKGQLKEALSRLMNYFNSCNQFEIYNLCTDTSKVVQYQLGWYAQWILDNALELENNFFNLPFVKISEDRFCVRNDNQQCLPTFKSNFSFNSGIAFYEVVLLTDGKMRIGWTTWEARFSKDNQIGDDENSFGFDGCTGSIFNDKKEYKIKGSVEWKVGDVVGCMLDVDGGAFKFYLNGKLVESAEMETVHFSTQAYSGAVSLSSHQHCYFNFGQWSFRCAPKGVDNYHRATNKIDCIRFRLMQPVLAGKYYWFKREVMNNHVAPFFPRDDNSQQIFDETIRNIDNTAINLYNIEDNSNCLRYIQSVIEVLNPNDDKFDRVAYKIGQLLEAKIDSTKDEKICELVYPYLQLELQLDKDQCIHRNICIVLCNICKFWKSFKMPTIEYIREYVFEYLTQLMSKTSDQWIRLFVLIALDEWPLNQIEGKKIWDNEKIVKLFERWRDYFHKGNIIECLLESQWNQLEYQCYCLSEFLVDKVFQYTKIERPEIWTSKPLITMATLDYHDRTEKLRLSADLLSARSDCHWQSVRSVCDVDFGIYYYETLLLTSGPARVGWATKKTNLNKFEVGDDRYSIAFDGYHQCVWYAGQKYPLTESLSDVSSWKCGDVVGCGINITEQTFRFTLNGNRIKLPTVLKEKMHFSTRPYYAAISLATHQQFYFNFGHSNFRYCPVRFGYWSFHENFDFKKLKTIKRKFSAVDIDDVRVSSAIVAINSNLKVLRGVKIETDL